MADIDKRQEAVDRNFDAFLKKLPELIRTHGGKFALLRDGEVVEFFDTARDAMIFGQKTYSDGLFSVQEVTDRIVDLGYFSHAVHFDPV